MKVTYEQYLELYQAEMDRREPGWTVVPTNARSYRAAVFHKKRVIRVSREVMKATYAEQVELFWHELAHVKLGPGKGHGAEWRALMASYGYPQAKATYAA